MIIKPTFLDHYKTNILINLLKDKTAPLYLIRLWGFCETQKSDQLPDDPEAIKGICRFRGKAELLKTALISTGFVKNQNGHLTAHEWSEYNEGLLASWQNGLKGGLNTKYKSPTGSPGRAPQGSLIEPNGEPQSGFQGALKEPDQIRLDEIRVDASSPTSSSEPTTTTGMLAQVRRIKNIRKEFEGLRDVDIENALKDCPAEFREAAISDYERDLAESLAVPNMPLKLLRGYLGMAAKGPKSSSAGGGGGYDRDDGATDAEKNVEKAYQALADKTAREAKEKANGRK